MFVLYIFKHTCFHEKPLKTIQAFIKNGQNIRGFQKDTVQTLGICTYTFKNTTDLKSLVQTLGFLLK